MLKKFLLKRVKDTLYALALPAALYAENLIGKGLGGKKKEVAIEFILSKMPVYLKPFRGIIKKILLDVIDFAVELGVSKLHTIQRNLPHIIEG